MKILYLGKPSKIINFLRSEGNTVLVHDKKEHPDYLGNFDCIISYGYRYKIPKEMIDKVNGRGINLHISYLPWNRGSNPNYWSWHDNTQKGVTIHYLDENYDTGDIIVQKRVHFKNVKPLTLKTTYQKLSEEVEDLFLQNWNIIFYLTRHPQAGKGSYHSTQDKIETGVLGLDTPVLEI